jgi:hypothetical protein
MLRSQKENLKISKQELKVSKLKKSCDQHNKIRKIEKI